MISVDIVTPESVEKEISLTRNYLRQELKLTPAQCFVVLKMLLESFPEDYKPKEVK